MSILSACVTSQIEGSAGNKGSTKKESSIPTVLLVTAQGVGKQVPAEAFQLQHRNGKGMIAIKCHTGDKLVALHVVSFLHHHRPCALLLRLLCESHRLLLLVTLHACYVVCSSPLL